MSVVVVLQVTNLAPRTVTCWHGVRDEQCSTEGESVFFVTQSSMKINLRLILVSGKTKEFLFSPNDSASDIAKHVYDNWPMDWEEEQVSSPNILRLIYQGRFLHGNVTLGALKLPFGKTTVMHLVARETLPEPNSQGQRNREKTGESNCCVIL
ncbi:hypothetical protein E5288_WYG016753 [Bos mutus]|uniref:Ubiquitin-like protein 3 n=2 Tax=Laurasiatheria TaxID=314145 RepID=A0A6B0R3Q6_9CETA|nr:hypothetical protein [Bos mutus]